MRSYRRALVTLTSMERHIHTSIDIEYRTRNVVGLPERIFRAGGSHSGRGPRSTGFADPIAHPWNIIPGAQTASKH
jgi:hypothetical protein